MCPCCGEEEETTTHLFVQCQNPDIVKQRDKLHFKVRQAVKQKHQDASGFPPDFFTDSQNENKQPTEKWDNTLGNYGLIPHEWEHFVKSLHDEEDEQNAKYTIILISKAIMKVNNKIWKHRCKMLYTTINNDHVT
jgi:hypothetical protein